MRVSGRGFSVLLVILVLLVGLSACRITMGPPSVSRPEMVYEPELVGRITDVSHDGITDTYTVTVAGETFNIGPDAVSLEGSPGSSDSLLIYGQDGGTTWYASIGIVSTTQLAGCAVWTSSEAWDEADSIVFRFRSEGGQAVGIRLPGSKEWQEDISLEPAGRYPFSYNRWCIDLSGRVKAVYLGGGA
jgi:hypothetical protein